MFNVLLMAACFVLLTGMAMLLYKLTRLTGVESFALASAAAIVLQLIAGLFGNVSLGAFVSYAAGAAGVVLFILPFGKEKSRRAFFSPGFVLIAAGFLYALFAFQNAFLHNWDEFVQWGKAVRFVQETGQLPAGGMFAGTNPAGTTLFHHFFTRMTGYAEGNLYASGFLLVWMGLMLPASDGGWKHWPRLLLYAVIAYLALYALYTYPYLCIYVDMPVAAWAGGMAALWYLKKGKRGVMPLAAGVLFLLPLFKWVVGPMFAVILAFYMALIYFTSFDLPVRARIRAAWTKIGTGWNWLFLAVPLVIFLSLWVWSLAIQSGASVFPRLDGASAHELFNLSSEKARLTFAAGLDAVFSKNLGRSGLHVTYFSFAVAMIVTALVLSLLPGDHHRQYRWLWIFYFAGLILYFLLMMFMYINTFPFKESIRVASIIRYFSIYAVFGAVLLLSPLLSLTGDRKNRWGKIIFSIVLAIVLAAGLKGNFFEKYASAAHPENLDHHEDVVRINRAAPRINELVGDDEKILFIEQRTNGGEANIANYALYNRVAPAQSSVFEFTDGVRISQYANIDKTFDEMEQTIIEGGYDYLWVYRTDDQFTVEAGRILHADIEEGGFYRIERDDGGLKLRLVGNY